MAKIISSKGLEKNLFRKARVNTGKSDLIGRLSQDDKGFFIQSIESKRRYRIKSGNTFSIPHYKSGGGIKAIYRYVVQI